MKLKSGIRQKLNISKCADRRSETKKISHVLPVPCFVSGVMCCGYLSLVTCHQRQQPQPQSLPMLIPPLCKIGWFSKQNFLSWVKSQFDPKFFQIKTWNPSNSLKLKGILSVAILAIQSSTRNLQSMRFRILADGTNTQTYPRTFQLIDWIGLGADWVKILFFFRGFHTEPQAILCSLTLKE